MIILGVLIILLLLDRCNDRKVLSNLSDKMESISINVPEVIFKRNSVDSSIVAIQKQIILNNQEGNALGLTNLKTELGELKKITNRIALRTEYLISNVEKPYEPGTVITELPDGKYLKLPYSTSFGDSLYSVGFTQTLNGPRLDSLRIWDKTHITLGTLKKGFFKRSEPTLLFENQNKYITGIGLTNYTIKYKPAWYETRLFNMAAGAFLLFGAQQITKP